MRDHPIDRADDVRAFLERMAGEAPATLTVPGRAIRRARRRLAATVVAGVAVLALAGYGAVAVVDVARDWNRSIPASQDRTPVPTPSTPATSATPGAYGRGSASEELSGYVLQTFEGPGAADRFSFVVGKAWALGPMARTFDIAAEDLLRAGILDAHVTYWATPRWLEGNGGKDLISVAILFRDPAEAREGFALFDVESSWQEWRWLPTPGLGGDAIAAEGRVGGKATVSYAWRFDDLVLVVASQGSLSPEVVGPLAEEMQRLVERFHPPS